MKEEQPAAHLLVQASQHLEPVQFNEVYHWFTWVNLPIKPSPRSASVLAEQILPRGCILAFAGVHCPARFTPPDYS